MTELNIAGHPGAQPEDRFLPPVHQPGERLVIVGGLDPTHRLLVCPRPQVEDRGALTLSWHGLTVNGS